MEAFSNWGRVVGTFSSQSVIGRRHLDLAEKVEIERLLDVVDPGVVLCPAFISYVERCEREPELTRAVNVQGIDNLVAALAHRKLCFVFFSSDYVFDGSSGPYKETDSPGPINEYGRQKLLCERLIQARLEDALIIRTSGVYGWQPEGKNFVMTLLSRFRRGDAIKVPKDQDITPTFAPMLAGTVLQLAKAETAGIYHVAGGEVLLRSEFARLIAKVFELDPELVIPIETQSLGLAAPRPRHAGLDCGKVATMAGIELWGPERGLEEMRVEEN